mgnify:CR=1 FL=1|tara:strand:- start:295 stop:594 length:300 start_codon:yes stop_codon:yes gene_type:complete
MESELLFDTNEQIYTLLKQEKSTKPYLTKYEYAKIIGISAQQIETGRVPSIKIPTSIVNPIEIAEYELQNKATPFIVKRKLPNNEFEYWTIDQLDLNIN